MPEWMPATTYRRSWDRPHHCRSLRVRRAMPPRRALIAARHDDANALLRDLNGRLCRLGAP